MTLEGINHRIYRAGQALHLLESEVREFINSGKAYVFSRDDEESLSVRFFEVRANEAPTSIARRAGGIAVDLLAALHDLAAIVAENGGAEFPVARAPDEFDTWVDAHCPEIGEEERALLERAQPYDGWTWLSDLREVAARHMDGSLHAEVRIEGNIRRSFPVDEVKAELGGNPRVAHVIPPEHPVASDTFNVHMHIALAVEVVAATPMDVVQTLAICHSSVRELVDALAP